MAKLQLNDQARAFAREVGSIVLGVLIALCLGEVADELRWRGRAAETNAAMNVELSHAAGALDARVIMQPCIDRRLIEIDGIIKTAQRSNRLPDIRSIGGLTLSSYQTAAWDDAVAGGVFLHLNANRRLLLSTVYPLLKSHPEDMIREAGYWATLKMIQERPGRVSEAVLSEVSLAAAKLKLENFMAGQGARQLLETITAAGIKPNYDFVFDEGTTRAEAIAQIASSSMCRGSLVQP